MKRGRGRPPGHNIFRIGYERAARYIADRVWDQHTRCACWVTADGGIIVREVTDERFNAPGDECLVGIYDKHMRCELIEDDLLARLVEISAQNNKRAAA